MPDGRFLSSVVAGDDALSGTGGVPQIRVVLNWFEELRRLVPTK
jgi:hypothetical protein